MLRKLDADELWAYALKSLGRRAQTLGEIRVKLRARAAAAQDVELTLRKLREYGFADDRKFADQFAQTRLENRGLGKARTLRDLRQRRVAPGVAEKAVERAYGETDEVALIEQYVRRKWRNAARDGLFGNDRELGSAFRHLQGAGFSAGNIIRVLKRFARNPELLDGVEE